MDSPALTAAATPAPSIEFTRWLAVGSLLGLVLVGLGWELGSWWALKVLPLCVPLAGLLRRRMYTYRWVSLLVWIYFAQGVVAAWSDPAPVRWWALAQVLLSLLLFVACVLHVRWRLRKGKA
jgi:uncharacterized membrane protein